MHALPMIRRGARRWTAAVLPAVFGMLQVACGGASEVMRPLTGEPDVDALFAAFSGTGSPGCALGIIQDGEFSYRRGYGAANVELDVGIDADTVFRVGSVSKQFTAMVVLLLEEAGSLSLDDELSRWVPEISGLGPITVRHLMHHTSGFRDYLVLGRLAGYRPADFYTADDLLALLSRQRALNFPPGEEFLYSNSGYFLLGVVAERATGRSLAELGEELIFGPLGMSRTQFYDDPNRVVPGRASGYTRTEAGLRVSMTTLPIVGDGGVFTSVNDLLAWDRNFYDNQLGESGQALIDRWLTPGVLNDGAPAGADRAYAAGITLGQYRGALTVSHGGGFVGFRAQMIRFPWHRTSVITLCNVAQANPTELALGVADVVLAEVLGPGPAPREAATDEAPAADEFDTPLTQLRPYAGRYVSRELGVTYVVAIQDGRLRVSLPGRWDQAVTQIGEDVLQAREDGLRLGFQRDSAGAVSGFLLDAGRVTGLWFERVG